MKKAVVFVFALVLALALGVAAYAADDTFDPTLDVVTESNKITVTIEDSPVFAQHKPSLTIPCEGWYGAEVTLDGETLDSTFVYESVTFTVSRGGTYVIKRIYPYVAPVAYYPLTFETNGGSEIAALRLAENSVVDLAKYVPQRAGYTFVGWYSDAALTEEVSSLRLDCSKTVYAKWQLSFTDVENGAYYHDAVLWALGEGVTEGTGDTSFSPHNTCTRAEMMTFLWRAAGSPAPLGVANPFGDVTEADYCYNAVLWAYERGIVQGTGSGRFSPHAPCSRGQMATFLYRYEGEPVASGANPFEDVSEGGYYYNAVLWAAEAGITKGTGPASFSPDAVCTRAHIVTFLYRHFSE